MSLFNLSAHLDKDQYERMQRILAKLDSLQNLALRCLIASIINRAYLQGYEAALEGKPPTI